MAGEPPSNWDLQRQITAVNTRLDRTDDRIMIIQRDFVTHDQFQRELRHIVEDVAEVAASQKEVAADLKATIDKQRERDDERERTSATQRRNLTLLICGWLVSLVVAVSAPIIVQALSPGR